MGAVEKVRGGYAYQNPGEELRHTHESKDSARLRVERRHRACVVADIVGRLYQTPILHGVSQKRPTT